MIFGNELNTFESSKDNKEEHLILLEHSFIINFIISNEKIDIFNFYFLTYINVFQKITLNLR